MNPALHFLVQFRNSPNTNYRMEKCLMAAKYLCVHMDALAGVFLSVHLLLAVAEEV